MKGYKLKRGMFYFVRSFLFSAFSRCGRLIAKKLLPFCLCFLFLISVFTFNSFAESNLINPNLTQWTEYQSSNPNFSSVGSGKFMVSFSGQSQGNVFIYYKLTNSEISIKDSYELSFDVWGHFERVNCYVLASFNGQVLQLDGVSLGRIYANFASSDNSYTTFKTKFVPSNIYDGGISSLEIVLMFQIENTSTTNLYFQNMKLINVTDEAGFFQSILDWLSRLYCSIAGGTDTQGVTHTGLIQGIVDGISNTLNSVKTAITNAIAGIQQWFIDLKDNIINGLKSLFIPSENYFTNKLNELNTWCTNHFGVLFQGPQIALQFLRKLFEFSASTQYVLTIPNYTFTFAGETYSLSSGSSTYSFDWVNDSSHPLYYFYTFYRAFVTIILFFMFFNYVKNKFLQIFNNGVGVDES